MTLRDFLAACVSTKTITVNLYNEKGLALITFNLPGYACLDDEIELKTIKSWTINNLTTINITLNGEEEQP